jgi:hypothetical protein
MSDVTVPIGFAQLADPAIIADARGEGIRVNGLVLRGFTHLLVHVHPS